MSESESHGLVVAQGVVFDTPLFVSHQPPSLDDVRARPRPLASAIQDQE